MVAVTLWRVREDVLEPERRTGLVGSEGVDDVERVRGRRNVGEVELGHLADGREDVVQLHLEARDLVPGQLEASERRHVQYVISGDRHAHLLAKQRGPLSGASDTRFRKES